MTNHFSNGHVFGYAPDQF